MDAARQGAGVPRRSPDRGLAVAQGERAARPRSPGGGGKRSALVDWLCFRLDVKEPPASTLGREYGTVDERCAACCIYGGPEGTCVEWPIELQERKQRPCPRVDLDPALAPEAEALGFLLHDKLQHVASVHVVALAEALELSADERLALLRRLLGVLSHPDVVARVSPAPELPDA